ncbi:MAG: hypothetical protein AAF614_15780 [Chloroflexota bacterium]
MMRRRKKEARPSFIARLQGRPAQRRTNRDLAISSLALGISTTSFFLPAATVFAPISLPLSLFVFVPTFKLAYQSLREEWRVTNPVLTTTRLGVCVVMNFHTIAALDAFLFSMAQKWQSRSQLTWAQRMDALFVDRPAEETAVMRPLLEQAVQQESGMQQRGNASANRMAPWMLGAFVVTLPFYGANRAASFLMTSFGAHMQSLSPTTLHEFMRQAAERGIVVKNGRSLETANQCDVLIIDAKLLNIHSDNHARVNAIRQQLAAAQGVSRDEIALYLIDSLPKWDAQTIARAEKTAVIAQLQQGGRRICYVGDGLTDAEVMNSVELSISLNGLPTIVDDAAHIVLLNRDLATVEQFFAGTAALQHKQSFNFAAPIGFDFVDISTTVFVHLGLLYSTMFNYSGLLLSTGQAKRPFFPDNELDNEDAIEPASEETTLDTGLQMA